jgi:RNA-directed DNA polymerase
MTKTSLKTTVVWNTINWAKAERMVFKLQKRIHKAAQRDDVKVMRRLQKTLMKSWYGRLLATRQVTQDNKGKNTAGIDGVKSLGSAKRLRLAANLGTSMGRAVPTRRIWIPKPGKDEKRPLSIPAMADRANQALAKIVLEPQWFANFEPNSYGFRPGKATLDAIQAIRAAIHCKAKYVLAADISQCFDNIDHQKLLNKLNTYPSMRRLIRSWLKSGFMDGQDIFPTTAETPQGGVISPLLANIALHGMEEAIKEYANTLPTRRNYGKKQNRNALSLIRYADDFVIIHEDVEVVMGAKAVIEGFLKDIGLELSSSKTRICHTFESYEGKQPGFDFLGFNIRQFPANDGVCARNTNGEILGFTTLIQPNKKALQSHYKKISDIIDSHKAAPQKVLIQKLNPIIDGWARYYSSENSTEVFNDLNHLIYRKLMAWGKSRHGNKGSHWIVDKYWTKVKGDKWVFGYQNPDTDERYILSKHTWTKIVRFTKVKGEASTYNGDFVYWSTRTGKSKEIPSILARTLQKQKGKCEFCNLAFTSEDQIELDHIMPISLGGKRKLDNLQALHRHCHDQKTANDGSLSSSYDKGMFSEEPCEVKVSCTVLETSSTCEGVA